MLELNLSFDFWTLWKFFVSNGGIATGRITIVVSLSRWGAPWRRRSSCCIIITAAAALLSPLSSSNFNNKKKKNNLFCLTASSSSSFFLCRWNWRQNKRRPDHQEQHKNSRGFLTFLTVTLRIDFRRKTKFHSRLNKRSAKRKKDTLA